MAVQMCCNYNMPIVTMAAITTAAATPDACFKHAGPQAFATGVQQNGSCGYCQSSGILSVCEADTAGFVASSVQYPGRVNKSGCVGKWCLACKGSGVLSPPTGSTIYVSSECGYFMNMSSSPSLMPVPVEFSSELHNVTFEIGPSGMEYTVSNISGPLTLVGHTVARGGPIHFITSQYKQCPMKITNDYNSLQLESLITSSVAVEGDAECGIAVMPRLTTTSVVASITMNGVSHTGPSDHIFYSIATANIGGTINTNWKRNTAVVLDRSQVHRLDLVSDEWQHILNLSAYLSIFGTEYEIAYYHDGERTIPSPPWQGYLAQLNRKLAPVAAVVVYALTRVAIADKEKRD